MEENWNREGVGENWNREREREKVWNKDIGRGNVRIRR